MKLIASVLIGVMLTSGGVSTGKRMVRDTFVPEDKGISKASFRMSLQRFRTQFRTDLEFKKGKHPQGLVDVYVANLNHKGSVMLYAQGNAIKMVQLFSVFRSEELSIVPQVLMEDVLRSIVDESAVKWLKSVQQNILSNPEKSVGSLDFKHSSAIVKLTYESGFRSLKVTIYPV